MPNSPNLVPKPEVPKAKRASRQARGYGNTHMKLRKVVLCEEPFCRVCGNWATQMDHIDGNNKNNDRANLQGLCAPCHSRKTIRQTRG